MTASIDSADPAVSRFLDAVWMERGLSPNTLAAYRADLTALARWLAERNVPIMRTSRADLQDFIAWRVRAGARPRSTARQLSSFRRFFRYFMREGVIREDPTAQIAMPKIGRSLPRGGARPGAGAHPPGDEVLQVGARGAHDRHVALGEPTPERREVGAVRRQRIRRQAPFHPHRIEKARYGRIGGIGVGSHGDGGIRQA